MTLFLRQNQALHKLNNIEREFVKLIVLVT
jgi:hypothetical protein